jgi:hypothetical protein
MKHLGGVAQAKGHEGELQDDKGSGDGSFLSPGWTGIWLYALKRSILEKKQQPASWWG